MPIFSCRDWLINIEERRVIRNGLFLDLTPKSFDVIQLLIERHGNVVSKDDILGIVWNGSFVEEGNLPVHISKIRRVLGDTRKLPCIETVPGVGYRFIGPLKKVSEEKWVSATDGLATERRSMRNSIAVFPFTIAGGDPENDYLSEGVYFQLTNTLARLSNLRVLARDTAARIAKEELSTEEIYRRLGVTYIVQGRMRIVRNQIYLNCEIIDCSSGDLVWGQNFTGPEPQFVSVEQEAVSAVTTEISKRVNLSSARKFGQHTNNFDSYRLYLKAKHFHEKATKADLNKAVDLLNDSIRHDPTHLASYVELAETYITMFCCDYRSNRATSEILGPILQIANQLSGHDDCYFSMLGGKAMYLDWNLEEAMVSLRRAININPSSILARYRLINCFLSRNRFGDALEELNSIRTIDPLSTQTLIKTARVFFKIGQFENAISYINEAIELSPDNYIALDILAAALLEIGEVEEAYHTLQGSLEINFNIETLSMLGHVAAIYGRTDETRQILTELQDQSSNLVPTALKIARLHLSLGQFDEAFDCLNLAVDNRDVDLLSLDVSPWWRPLRDDPRYALVRARIGCLE